MVSSNILLNYADIIDNYNIVRIKEEQKQWFPIKSSPNLAGLVADLMGDGHLQGKNKWRIDYTSKSIKELNRFNDEIFLIFRINGKIRKCSSNKYSTFNIGFNNKILAIILNKVGAPSGAKVLSSFSIPDWIINDKSNFGRFINRLFSCEGSVDVYSKCIEIKMYKSIDLIEDGLKFFQSIKDYLQYHFNIETTNPFLEGSINLRKDGKKTRGIRLKIKKKESLIRFNEFIGFEDKEKNIKLNKIINSFS